MKFQKTLSKSTTLSLKDTDNILFLFLFILSIYRSIARLTRVCVGDFVNAQRAQAVHLVNEVFETADLLVAGGIV